METKKPRIATDSRAQELSVHPSLSHSRSGLRLSKHYRDRAVPNEEGQYFLHPPNVLGWVTVLI